MTTGKKLCAFLVFICIFLPLLAQAKESDKLKKQKEGKFFWPVFEEFQEKLFQVNERAAKLIIAYASSYKSLTDDQAAIIVGEYFDIQKSRLKILDKYALKLAEGLPAKKVFRYLQVENKINAGARYELAKNIPLAE
jgi:hypothetical protein